MKSLDEVLSGREAAPAQDTTQETETTQAVTSETTETAGSETEQQTETEGEAGKDGKPPIGAIRQAERDKADKRYTAVLDNLRKEIADRDAAWERRLGQFVEAAKPKAEPPKAPDIFEDPSAFVHHQVNGSFSEVREVLTQQSRLIAEIKHGDDVVQAADAAFSQAVANRTLDPADYQRVIRSPNIYHAAVQWHKRIQAQQEIGDDPSAFKEKLREQLKAEILAETDAQNGQQQNGAGNTFTGTQAVMPSNLAAARNVGARSGPAWAGPKPIEDIFARKR